MVEVTEKNIALKEFYKGLERVIPQQEYTQKRRAVEERAFCTLFTSSNLNWVRPYDQQNPCLIETNVEVDTFLGGKVNLPFQLEVHNTNQAYLYLDSKDAKLACKNDSDSRVRSLVTSLGLSFGDGNVVGNPL